ncbi:MAG: substrate-binding domain-containing protein [Proteobacteria bacterium]|nr:substrate-binding domain-containing protein [Pseudomonadota bacterium]
MLLLLGCIGGAGFPASAERSFITLASTTSTDNSGLYRAILPQFEAATGIAVRVVAVGTGQALALARRGDADVLLVHHRPSEDAFVAEGYGVERHDVMWNDFVLVGPASDPAGVRGSTDAGRTLAAIAATRAVFVSRGDDSGTHKRERELWRRSSVDPSAASGTWYRELGAGMGRTLNTAAAMEAYTLTDRGTWLSFANKQTLEVVCEGDPPLRNPYGVIAVDPARHPHVKAEAAKRFVDWLIGPEGQTAIGAFRVAGQVLFHPAAAATPDP